MKKENAEILEVGKQAAFEAGQILMDNVGKIGKVSEKADGSFVTNVDVEAERKIVSLIRDKFPDHGILTEESDEIVGDSEYRWVIDPLDGTHNYMRGLDMFGVSIGVTHFGKPAAGIVYFPSSGKLYHCEKGAGAYLNGERIHVSGRELKDSILTHNSGFDVGGGQMFEGFRRLADSVFKVRMFGSCIVHLAHVADGRIDADVEYGLHPWDFFAGALLVEEAGGKVTDISGSQWHLCGSPLVASNGVFHDEIRKLLQAKGAQGGY